MRIFILEDDPLTALDLQLVVESDGHEVTELCDTLAGAWRRLGDDVDFAFLDIDLPDGKSFGIAAQLAACHVPFAFVSASNRSEVPPGLRGAAFIAKPYRHAAIRDSLAAAGRSAC